MLRLRLLADLALRVEVPAWPREVVEALLRATDKGEKALRQTPYMPNYVKLLEQPARLRHTGEMRLWTYGYSSLEQAKNDLTAAAEQFERLIRVNEHWNTAERELDEMLAELPSYVKSCPTALPELREPWLQAIAAAAKMADDLKARDDDEGWLLCVEQTNAQAHQASAVTAQFQVVANTLRAPFAKDAIASLERAIAAPQADGRLRQMAETILSVGGPIMKAEDRVLLWAPVRTLSRRLNEETRTLDRQDDELQRCTPIAEAKVPPAEDETKRAAWRAKSRLAVLRLAGLSEEQLQPLTHAIEQCEKNAADPTGWCELGAVIRKLDAQASWPSNISRKPPGANANASPG